MGLAWDPIEDSYTDVARWIDKRVADFYATYGKQFVTRVCGDYDELRSYANEVFMEAYWTYDRSRGMNFSSWVGYKVWKGMLNLMNKGVNSRLKQAEGEMDDFPLPEKPKFRLREFVSTLSKDARDVVKMACVDTPVEVLVCMAERKLDTPHAMRSGLKEYLRDLGWTPSRIRQVFKEIQEALS